jgi:hypothetical protein
MEQKVMVDIMNLKFQLNLLLIVTTPKYMKELVNKTLTYDAVYGTEGDGEYNEPEVPVMPTVDSGHTQEHEDNGF